MGSCASKPSRDWMNDDYYDPDEDWHYGDQSWQFFRAQELDIYDSEFQPEPLKRKKSSGFRGKIQSLRKSFFNQGNSLENTPKIVRRESKGIKGKLESWRRSWFGPEPSPKPSRKLSLSQTTLGSKEEPVMRREKKASLSQSSINRLSVTRNFVEKHGQVDEVYRKKSKPTLSDEISYRADISPQNSVPSYSGHSQVIVSQTPRLDIEEEISECKIQNRNAEREFLAKIKEIGSFDYGYDSDEDVTRLSHALRSPNMNSTEEHENGEKQRDTKERSTVTSEKSGKIMKEEDSNHEDQIEPKKSEMEDQYAPVDEEKLEEGLALFNDECVSEEENSTTKSNEAKEEPSRKDKDLEEKENESTLNAEEQEEPKTKRSETKNAISIKSSGTRRAGATIQISSKGRT